MRGTTRTRCTAVVLAGAVAGMLCTTPGPARAGYGGGGKQQASLPANVKVRVKKGSLVMSGTNGTLLVAVTSTDAGLRVEGRGDTKINGGSEAFLATDVTGDWRIRFPRARASELTVGLESPSAPRPRIGTLVFVGGLRSELDISGVDITGDAKISMTRSLVDKGSLALFDGCTVGGDIKMRSSSFRGDLLLQRTTVGGRASFLVRPRGRTPDQSMRMRAFESDIGSIRVRSRLAPGQFELYGTTVRGDVALTGSLLVEMYEAHLQGDCSLAADAGEQWIDLHDSTVSGRLRLSTGRNDDVIDVRGGLIGVLEVRGGSGNDLVRTRSVTIGDGSSYDGGRGRGDSWETTDESLLTSTAVESVGPPID